MSTPRNPPPAPPGAGVVPLPAPRDPTKKDKDYSEGSMYEDMSQEDIDAWHRRYAEFKRWRQEIPNRAGGVAVGVSPSMSLGVGSADWEWRESSECGTVPSTIVERERKKVGSGTMGPQAEPPAPMPPSAKSKGSQSQPQALKSKIPQGQQARVSTQSHSTTIPSQPPTKTTSRPPLQQKTSISQNLAQSHVPVRPTPTQPPKVPTIEIQPPSNKLQERRLPTRQSSNATVRPSPSPVLAQPPKTATQVVKSGPLTKSKGESKTPSARSNGSAVSSPGELVVPSPTPSAKYAEREAYINSALSLPLDMLTEKEEGHHRPPPPQVESSSQLTTSRLDSLLGRSRSDKQTQKIGSQRSTSSTTLPSIKSDRLDERQAQHRLDSVIEGEPRLARSKTTTAVPVRSHVGPSHRGHLYEASDHLPVPGMQAARSRTPTDTTVKHAANRPLPPSTTAQSKAPTMAEAASRPLPPSTIPPLSQTSTVKLNMIDRVTAAPSAPHNAQTRTRTQPTQHPPSDATVIKAARAPLPLSVPSHASHTEHIQVPVSVKTSLASSGPNTKAPPTDATVTRAAHVPLPASTARRTITQASAQSDRTIREDKGEVAQRAAPSQVPLPPTAASELAPPAASRPSSAATGVLTHRQQMPLPRPALTPQSSFDGLSRTLSRKTRDPSMPDLTARFEPAMYPLPPSGATIFSSPEAMTYAEARIGEHEVAFRTVEYIPQAEPKSGVPSIAPSTPAAPAGQSLKPATARSAASARPRPKCTSVQARETPLPPSRDAPASVGPDLRQPLSVQQHVSLLPSATMLDAEAGRPHVAPPVPSKNPSGASRRPLPTSESGSPQSPSGPRVHPHIHFSPGQVSQSLRSEDGHVSFEVPSGTRGRLRVTLKWLRDGARSDRGSPPTGGRTLAVIDEDDRAPPVPPKTSSLMSRVIGRSGRTQSQPWTGEPRSKLSSGTTTNSAQDRRRSVEEAGNQQPSAAGRSREDAEHPISLSERPILDAPSQKRDDPKYSSSVDKFPPDQQAQQQHHPSGPAPALLYNPYYSGATLPAYRPGPQVPQVYNMMSPPFGYPQPGPGPGNAVAVPQMGWDAYRPMVQPGQPNDPDSPARQSIDPPSDNGDDQPAPPMLPNMQYPYPQARPRMMGMGEYGPGAQGQPAWYGQGPTRPNIWQRMFKRPSQDGPSGPEDNTTIRNWRKEVAPGRAPTVIPNPSPYKNAPPTVGPSLTVRAEGYGRTRPIMAPTVFPGTRDQGMQYSPGPGTTLYDARYGYVGGGSQRRDRDRERSPSVWEKLMVRRQVDEAIYASPPRRREGRNLPDPAPMPPRSARPGVNTGREGLFSPRSGIGGRLFSTSRYRSGRKEYDRQGLEIKRISTFRDATRAYSSRDADRNRERSERTARRRMEKEERRRQRAVRRDERAKEFTRAQPQGQGNAYMYGQGGVYSGQPTTPTPVGGRAGIITDQGGTMGIGLNRTTLGRTDMRDRPVDLGGDRGGRSKNVVGDWVGALGVRRTREQLPSSERQNIDYRPVAWKDRLKINRSQPRAGAYNQAQTQPRNQLPSYTRPLPIPTPRPPAPGRNRDGSRFQMPFRQDRVDGRYEGQKLRRGPSGRQGVAGRTAGIGHRGNAKGDANQMRGLMGRVGLGRG
ncbi:hypothetical protein IAU59_007506 [Kwoniella sp. CBS 9459]